MVLWASIPPYRPLLGVVFHRLEAHEYLAGYRRRRSNGGPGQLNMTTQPRGNDPGLADSTPGPGAPSIE